MVTISQELHDSHLACIKRDEVGVPEDWKREQYTVNSPEGPQTSWVKTDSEWHLSEGFQVGE